MKRFDWLVIGFSLSISRGLKRWLFFVIVMSKIELEGELEV